MNSFKRMVIVPLAATALVAVSACSSASATPASSAAPTSAVVGAGKVSANNATTAELQQAFTAAGIANPDRWAREVAEYRPYPTDDPTFAKLRGELAKYNPAPGVVDQIVATLAL